jgi:hypothetical protein
LSGAIAKAKEAWVDRKRRRIEVSQQGESQVLLMAEGSLEARQLADEMVRRHQFVAIMISPRVEMQDQPMNEVSGPGAVPLSEVTHVCTMWIAKLSHVERSFN